MKGRFGITGQRFLSEDQAVFAALKHGASDKRSVPAADAAPLRW
jgi:hypothetical protein